MTRLYKEWIGLRVLEFRLNTETPSEEMKKVTPGSSDGTQKLNTRSPRKKETTGARRQEESDLRSCSVASLCRLAGFITLVIVLT